MLMIAMADVLAFGAFCMTSPRFNVLFMLLRIDILNWIKVSVKKMIN